MNEQNDRMTCETLLIETKGLCDLMMHGTIESATPDVRAAFSQALQDTLSMQQKIYDSMANKGWYPSAQAQSQQISQTKQKFANMQ